MGIWKRRALEADARVRHQDQIIDQMGEDLNAMSGPTFMGEPVLPRQQAREVVSDAARDLLAERQRQISAEGMTNAGDDGYRAAELPRAAAAYILNGANDEAPAIWPWAKAWWKPRDARANYVRAGALILAEIERLDRLNGGSSHE